MFQHETKKMFMKIHKYTFNVSILIKEWRLEKEPIEY